MSSLPILFATSAALVALALSTIAVFLIYVAVRYSPIVGRIFEDKPMFLPLRVARVEGGEDVTFATKDRLRLAGTYFRARAEKRAGVLVFCHEYLSDRWGVLPYLDHLRDRGYDLFAFDFRNHGESARAVGYNPLQWVTDNEVLDLRGALEYLRGRPDADPAGFGLFGVSRGGGTALYVASSDPRVWGLVTDGAFPTRGLMLHYILRWAEIYVGSPRFWRMMPKAVFAYLGWSSRVRTEIRLGCHYPNIERAARRLAPRPWMMIHGQKDAYISVEVAKELFALAGDPKNLWIVPGAKHNRCREKDPALYAERLAAFLAEYGPRRPLPAGQPEADAATTGAAAVNFLSASDSAADLAVATAG